VSAKLWSINSQFFFFKTRPDFDTEIKNIQKEIHLILAKSELRDLCFRLHKMHLAGDGFRLLTESGRVLIITSQNM
jgi:predicted metalloenzyme YecM